MLTINPTATFADDSGHVHRETSRAFLARSRERMHLGVETTMTAIWGERWHPQLPSARKYQALRGSFVLHSRSLAGSSLPCAAASAQLRWSNEAHAGSIGFPDRSIPSLLPTTTRRLSAVLCYHWDIPASLYQDAFAVIHSNKLLDIQKKHMPRASIANHARKVRCNCNCQPKLPAANFQQQQNPTLHL